MMVDESDYGEEYLFWKSWGKQSFATLEKRESRYFDKIVAVCNLNSSNSIKVLEVGFGNGSFLKYCTNQEWDVTGCEINEHLVEMGKNEGYDVFHSDKMSSLNDQSFDLIVAFDVLEHIPVDQALSFLSNLKRLLKNGGVLVARFPNGDSPFSLPFQNGDTTHVNYIGGVKAQYYIDRLNMHKEYIGPDLELLLEHSVLGSIRRLVSLSLRLLIELFVKLVFYRDKGFTAKNMLVIAKK